MIFLAYDGSIHSDWVSHYALRMAVHDAEHRLTVVRIEEESFSQAEFDRQVLPIETECQHLGIAFDAMSAASIGTIAQSICRWIPQGTDSFLVCGTRFRERKRGFLAGTVSQELLTIAPCHVLAVHVVHPGVLGMPRQMLVPLAGHPRGLRLASPFLRLFAPDMDRLHLMTVMEIPRWRYRWLSSDSTRRMMQRGYDYLRDVEQQFSTEAEFTHVVVDSHVVVSDDPVKEIVIATHRTKSRLILAGASERSLSTRFFYGNPLEKLLREAPCDMIIYRGPA